MLTTTEVDRVVQNLISHVIDGNHSAENMQAMIHAIDIMARFAYEKIEARDN